MMTVETPGFYKQVIQLNSRNPASMYFIRSSWPYLISGGVQSRAYSASSNARDIYFPLLLSHSELIYDGLRVMLGFLEEQGYLNLRHVQYNRVIVNASCT